MEDVFDIYGVSPAMMREAQSTLHQGELRDRAAMAPETYAAHIRGEYGYEQMSEADQVEFLRDYLPVREHENPAAHAWVQAEEEKELQLMRISESVGVPLTADLDDDESIRGACLTALALGYDHVGRDQPQGGLKAMREAGVPMTNVDAVTGAALQGDPCPTCGGNGLDEGKVCPGCKGSGLVPDAEDVQPMEEDAVRSSVVPDIRDELTPQQVADAIRMQREAASLDGVDDLAGADREDYDDLDDDDNDDDDLESATSLNSGKKKRRPKSSARKITDGQVADNDKETSASLTNTGGSAPSGRIIQESAGLQAMADWGIPVRDGVKLPPPTVEEELLPGAFDLADFVPTRG